MRALKLGPPCPPGRQREGLLHLPTLAAFFAYMRFGVEQTFEEPTTVVRHHEEGHE
jgi:hypothetical protein